MNKCTFAGFSASRSSTLPFSIHEECCWFWFGLWGYGTSHERYDNRVEGAWKCLYFVNFHELTAATCKCVCVLLIFNCEKVIWSHSRLLVSNSVRLNQFCFTAERVCSIRQAQSGHGERQFFIFGFFQVSRKSNFPLFFLTVTAWGTCRRKQVIQCFFGDSEGWKLCVKQSIEFREPSSHSAVVRVSCFLSNLKLSSEMAGTQSEMNF